MSELAELLELLYLARTRWRTVRLTMTDWTHLDRQQDAYERSLGLEGTSPPHSWGELSATSRTWAEAGGRYRQEREGVTLVHDGDRTWLATPESGVVEHESRGMRPIGDELLDPASFLPGFDFELAGRRPRPRDGRRSPWPERRGHGEPGRSTSSPTAPMPWRSPSTASAGSSCASRRAPTVSRSAASR